MNKISLKKLVSLPAALATAFMLTAVFLNPQKLVAGMIPFGFWKKQDKSTCVFSANTTIDNTNQSSYLNCHWDISSGTVVTINTNNTITIGNLVMNGGGSKIQQATCTTTTCPQVSLDVTGDATIPAGSSINVDATGFLGGRQSSVAPATVTTNAADTGQTYGFLAGANLTGGGSHGGWGGWNSAQSTHVPSKPYENPKTPTNPGSGGGANGAGKTGGNGGGVIKLVVSGTLSLDGTLSANGGTSICGAGAGGSIWIQANTITSATTGLLISANGGTGGIAGAGTCGSSRPAGGGGGGRIALYYGSLGGVFALNSTFIQAYGGTQPANANYYGGSGTIYAKSTSQTQGDLYIYGPNNSKYTYNGTPIGIFGWSNAVSSNVISFTSYTWSLLDLELFNALIPDADAMTLNQLMIIGNNPTSISTFGTDMTTLTAAGRLWANYEDRHNSFDNVYISDASIVHTAYLNVSNVVSVSNTSKLVAANIIATTVNLNDTSVLSHFSPETNYVGRLKVTATNMSIATGAKIDVNGLGYLGGRSVGLRTTNIASNTGMTTGLTTTGGSTVNTGGSHAGYGGYYEGASWKTYFPGVPYGSIAEPIDSGGGGGTNGGNAAGNGGGVVYLNLSSLTIDGAINAKGNDGGNTGDGGAGAGGSIWVRSLNITSSTAALKFNARGGDSGNNCGGGGGRIALYYFTIGGTVTFASNRMSAEGGLGWGPLVKGNAGTIYTYIMGTSTYGNLYVLDSNYSTFHNLILSPFGRVTSTTSSTLTDSALTSRGRDYYFTRDQVVGKTLTVNPHLLTTTDYTITDYNAATGTFTLSGDPSGVANSTYWFIKGFNTHYDNFYIYGIAYTNSPYINATNIISSSASDIQSYFLRIDATTINLTAGYGKIRPWQTTGSSSPPLPLVINAQTLTVGNNWKINADGLGYVGGNTNWNVWAGREGPFAVNNTNYGFTNGNTTTGGSQYGAGGSHAGYGGSLGGYIPATPYGDPLQPFTFGSGGGGDTSSTYNWGGSGGGVIVINATGTVTINGVVSANPDDTSSGGYSAGGAGSIWITANTIATAKTASTKIIQARGVYTNTASGAGGGGGRIALYYNSLTTVNINNLDYSGSTSSGGLTGSGNGGAGSAYMKPNSGSGNLYYDNAGIVPSYLETPAPAYNVTLANLSVTNNAIVKQISSLNTITVNSWVQILNPGSMLYVPNNGTIDNTGPWTWFTYTSKSGTITEY